METEDYKTLSQTIQRKVTIFFEKNWPGIHRAVNSAFYGIIEFIRDTVSSVWRRY